MLTHLWPGTDHPHALPAASAHYDQDIVVATPGLVGPSSLKDR